MATTGSDSIPAQRYVSLRQLPATNLLTKTMPKLSDRHPVTGVCRVSKKELMVQFPANFSEEKSGIVSAYKLLDALVALYTEQGAKNPNIKMSIAEYAQLLGAKDKGAVRASISKCLVFLDALRFSYTGAKGGMRHFADMRILSCTQIKNGIVSVDLSEGFVKLLKGSSVMQCPTLLWRIHPVWNPHSYFFLRRLAEHKRMNRGAANEDRISVRVLLEAAPSLPSYAMVASSTRHINKQIIHPFRRDMNALSETLAWRFCRKHGVALQADELKRMTYYQFEKLLVQVDWKDFPSKRGAMEERESIR